MDIACLDLEGVLIPEIWIELAERTGIEALQATTRDVPDYDVLMRQRLHLLAKHDLDLSHVQAVVADMGPMPGARNFIDWLRENFQVVILSDTFYEFAMPLMPQLGWPTLLCHKLQIDEEGRIVDYRLRQADPKRKAVQAFHGLNYRVVAAGDSYNDVAMLAEADTGILFRPPQNVIDEYPNFPVTRTYDQLQAAFREVVKPDCVSATQPVAWME